MPSQTGTERRAPVGRFDAARGRPAGDSVKIELDRSRERARWSLETNPVIDRAIAAVIFAAVLVLLHVLGVDDVILRLLWETPLVG